MYGIEQTMLIMYECVYIYRKMCVRMEVSQIRFII